MKRIICILVGSCLFIFFLFTPVQASYLGRSSAKGPESGLVFQSDILSQLLEKSAQLQKGFRVRMSSLTKRIRAEGAPGQVLLFMAICFLYGVFHAAGPGHGKIVVSTYFLAKGGGLKGAVLFGNLLAMVHVGSAVFLILVLAYISDSMSIFSFTEMSERFYPFSYLMITLVGVGLLITTFWNSARKDRQTAPSDNIYEKSDLKAIFGLALAAGMIPCPAAALILLFTINFGLFWIGLLGMAALAFGMGITTTLAGCVSLGMRKACSDLFRRYSGAMRPAHTAISTLGALIIIIFGLLMFIGGLSTVSI